MHASKVLGMAAVLGLVAVAMPSDSVGADDGGLPPTITSGTTTNPSGVAGVYFDVVDPDGAADITGISYGYLMANGTAHANPLQITLYMIKNKLITVSDITNGKRVTLYNPPKDVAKIKTTAFDSEFMSASLTVDAPPRPATPPKPPKRRR